MTKETLARVVDCLSATTRYPTELLTADAELERRCREMDIHPAGELVGERSGHAGKDTWIAALTKARVAAAWRSLRLRVINLSVTVSDETVSLTFSLGRGSFATSVLREIAYYRPSLATPRRE